MGNFRPGIGYGSPVIAVFVWSVVVWVLLFFNVHAVRVGRGKGGGVHACNVCICGIQGRRF